jgi:hypothetical protein
MSTLQLKRGSAASVAAYTPALGEPVWNLTTQNLSIGDGATPGGIVVGSLTTTFAETLLAAVDPAAGRVVLGAQAAGTNLTALSAATAVIGSVPYWTGATTIGTFPVTSQGRTLLSKSTPADARTVLGAAASGANSDITSLSGLSTALSLPQGGTGGVQAYADLTLQNSWVVVASRRARYRKVLDMVYLEVQIQSGTATDGTVLATLPAGFRPAFAVAVPVVGQPNTTPSATVPGPRVVIGTDGTIVCQNCSASSAILFSTMLALT